MSGAGRISNLLESPREFRRYAKRVAGVRWSHRTAIISFREPSRALHPPYNHPAGFLSCSSIISALDSLEQEFSGFSFYRFFDLRGF
ncbi:hypothetical protein SAY86_008712 [Trapa natans]|uniref:Uncharacterized protein n=1 Tax=Trapa natans TaxID=22666 RepID=A0AAN7KDC9_TRANT|nr:hypothetical protein SAY86_008712 [Trapa natans]